MTGEPKTHSAKASSIRLKFFTTRLYGLSQPPQYQAAGLPFVRATNVERGKLIREGLAFVSEDDLPEFRAIRLRAGDIIVVRSGAYTGDSALVTVDWVGGVAGFDIVVRTDRYAEPKFLAYSLLSPTVLEQQIKPSSSRAAQPHLNAEELGEVEVVLPPVELQRTIVNFLDRETARIDALISAKERLLSLLAEKRRALITHAITRGLDPNVPLRDSGIPWLGKIPAHWELKRLKHVGRAIIGLTFEPANEVKEGGGGVLVLRASNVCDQRIVLDDNVYVSMHIPEELRTREGDILICARSGSRALIGKNAVIDSATAGVTFGAFMTVFRSQHNAFLFYVFNSPLFDYQAGAFSTSTINQLTVETLNGMEIPLPPLAEQEAIVKGLRERLSQLDSVAGAIAQTIALLKERRSALIAAAVTGKIAVEAAA